MGFGNVVERVFSADARVEDSRRQQFKDFGEHLLCDVRVAHVVFQGRLGETQGFLVQHHRVDRWQEAR